MKSIIDLKDSDLDEDNIEWIFKSFKQLIKINYRLEKYDEALDYLKELVKFIPNVNKNYAEESISKILTNYSTSNEPNFVNNLYDIILGFLYDSTIFGSNSDRLWLKININKLNILLELNDVDKCFPLIDSINEKLLTVSEPTRNSFSLDVIAAEIDCFSRQQKLDLVKLNELYCKSLTITSAVTHPKIMGIIRECGAKLQFYRNNFEKARIEFYECFKNFDEAGSPLKEKILKYLSLCSILTESEVNPFESQETQTYSQLPEYANLMLLIKAYDELNLSRYVQVLEKMKNESDDLIKDDIFIHASERIVKNLKTKILMDYLKSYKTIKFKFLMKKIEMNQVELEDTLLKLANLGKISNVKIDFINNYIETEPHSSSSNIIPPTLDAKQTYHNIKMLDAINISKLTQKQDTSVADSMEIDFDTRSTISHSLYEQDEGLSIPKSSKNKPLRESIFSKFLYLNKESTRPSVWIDNIASFLTYLKSAIPEKVADELSQKDQIASEQRAENNNVVDNKGQKISNNDDNEHDLVNQNTNAGILGSAITELNNEDEEDEEIHQDDKIDALRSWTKELKNHHEKLLEL